MTGNNVHPPRKGRVFRRSWGEELLESSDRLAGGEGAGRRKHHLTPGSPDSIPTRSWPGDRAPREPGILCPQPIASSWHSWVQPVGSGFVQVRHRIPKERNEVPGLRKVPGVLQNGMQQVSQPLVPWQSAPQIQTLAPSRSPAKRNWPTHPSVSLHQFGTGGNKGHQGRYLDSISESEPHTAPGRSRTDWLTQRARELGRRLRAINKLASLRNG